MEVLLADKVHKREPQGVAIMCHAMHCYHRYYIGMVACVKRIYIHVFVYALAVCQPVILPFLVCELCYPVVSSPIPTDILLISGRNLLLYA